MNILYYSKPSFADCDFPLIKALMDKGHDVKVIYILNPHLLRTTIFNISKQLPKTGILKATDYLELKQFEKYMPMENVYISNETTGKFGFNALWLDLKAFWFMVKQKPDVVNYVEDPSLLHSFLLWFLRKKLVVTIHDGRPHTEQNGWKTRFVRGRIRNYVRRYILLNKQENQLFEEDFRINPEYIFNSHLGYYEILKMYGDVLLKKGNYILFFGRISKYKGVDYLLKAMKLVHEFHPETTLIIAGKGDFHFDVTEYQKLEYIEFRNQYIDLDELANLIRGALFTVCPYTEATQSGVIYSSFALNTPVIATNVGGLPEMIDNGQTGMIVPPCDEQSLANAIKGLLDNPTELNRLSTNIAFSAEEGKGSWKLIADDYINVFSRK